MFGWPLPESLPSPTTGPSPTCTVPWLWQATQGEHRRELKDEQHIPGDSPVPRKWLHAHGGEDDPKRANTSGSEQTSYVRWHTLGLCHSPRGTKVPPSISGARTQSLCLAWMHLMSHTYLNLLPAPLKPHTDYMRPPTPAIKQLQKRPVRVTWAHGQTAKETEKFKVRLSLGKRYTARTVQLQLPHPPGSLVTVLNLQYAK
jgi:hypothetical protein